MQRSSEGNAEQFQATIHTMMILRGLLVSLGIVLAAPWVPILLNIQTVDFNFALLAIVPFITSFAHLDHQRLHRRQIYTVTAKIGLISDAISILTAFVCVHIWDNYWAFYISLVLKHSLSTIFSHTFAHRKYILGFDINYINSLLRFGLPLLFVGLLKYIGNEFDKAIITRIGGLEVFSIYVLTLLVLKNGTNIVTISLSKIFIRRVSTSGSNISQVVSSNGTIHCFLVLPILVLLCVLGEDIILMIFGSNYKPIPYLILTIGAVVGMRSINQWLNQTVIASSPTRLILMADLIRVVVALICVGFTYKGGNPIIIPLAFWVSEIVYFLVLSHLISKQFPIMKTCLFLISTYIACGIGIFVLYSLSYESDVITKIISSISLSFIVLASFLITSKVCREQVLDLLNGINLMRLMIKGDRGKLND